MVGIIASMEIQSTAQFSSCLINMPPRPTGHPPESVHENTGRLPGGTPKGELRVSWGSGEPSHHPVTHGKQVTDPVTPARQPGTRAAGTHRFPRDGNGPLGGEPGRVVFCLKYQQTITELREGAAALPFSCDKIKSSVAHGSVFPLALTLTHH